MVLGLTSKAVSDVLDEGSRGWDFVLMGACLESMGARVVDDSSAAGLAQGLGSLARCVVEQPETVIQVLRKLLPTAVWQKMSGTVFRVANLAKKALTRYLVLAEATFTIADVVTTLALPRSAFTVSLFAKQEVVPTKVVRIAGAATAGGPAPGYAVEETGEIVEGCTSSPASREPGIVACFPHAASADICWVQPDLVTLLCGGDPWEKKLYQYQSDQPIGDILAGDYEPSPWGLELAGGLRCRLRYGGSWGGRADGYVGAYYCGDDTQFVLAAAGEPLITQNSPQWTVKVGALGGDGDDFPPPKPCGSSPPTSPTCPDTGTNETGQCDD